MKRIARAAAGVAALSVGLWASAATAPSRQAVNASGQPLLQADGTRINYRKDELKAAPAARRSQALPRAGDGLASWGYAAYGSGIGITGMVSASVGGQAELYAAGSSVTFGGGDHWYALRWNRSAARFDQVFVSDYLPQGVRRIVLERQGGGAAAHIVAGLADGSLRRYDQQTKALLSNTAGACSTRGGLLALTAADMDGNGSDELLSVCGDQALVVEGSGYAGWSLAGVGGSELVVGQMDNDAALEVASTSGRVVDSGTHTVQWTWPQGFGAHLAVGDIDGDGRDELIAADAWYWVYAYDVERQLPKWSIRAELDIGAIQLADIDGDGVRDLLVGDGQWGSLKAYSAATQQLMGSVGNPEHGVTQIAVIDLNGDGTPELLWGAGATSSGPDHLYVADWPTKTIRWQNPDLVGPFLGPLVGDLDGDGIPEVVIATTQSDSGYASGRIIVFDSRTMAVRAISNGVSEGSFAWTGVHELKLRDVNGDGRLEILVSTDRLYDGLIEAYSLSSSNTFTRVWANATLPSGAPFYSAEIADVDGDGRSDVLGGVGYAHSGQQGYYVYAYDTQTGAEKWRTLNVGGEIFALLLGDYDGDGVLEIAAGVRGRGVYIFSAATHELEAIIDAPAITSLTRLDAYAIPRLLIGQADGRAHTHAFDGGTQYPEVQSVQLGSSRIDAITVGANRSWWVAAGGTLSRYAGGTLEFQTANYGTGFGRHVESIGNRGSVFSAGGFGIHRVDNIY